MKKLLNVVILCSILALSSCFISNTFAISEVRFEGDVQGHEVNLENGKSYCQVKIKQVISDVNNSIAIDDIVSVLYAGSLDLEHNEDVAAFGVYYNETGPSEYLGYVVCLESPYYMVSSQSDTSGSWDGLIFALLAIVGIFALTGFLAYFDKMKKEKKLKSGEFVEYYDRKGIRHVGPPNQIRDIKEKDELNENELQKFVKGFNSLFRKDKQKSKIIDDSQLQKISRQNPFLYNALISIANAVEFIQKKDSRYRQAALIEMDAGVESLFKARLFKDDPVNFMKSGWQNLGYQKALDMIDKNQPIPERELLNQAHTERNKAQHRAVIASHSWTLHHLENIRDFTRKFSEENFDLNLDRLIEEIIKSKPSDT